MTTARTLTLTGVATALIFATGFTARYVLPGIGHLRQTDRVVPVGTIERPAPLETALAARLATLAPRIEAANAMAGNAAATQDRMTGAGPAPRLPAGSDMRRDAVARTTGSPAADIAAPSVAAADALGTSQPHPVLPPVPARQTGTAARAPALSPALAPMGDPDPFRVAAPPPGTLDTARATGPALLARGPGPAPEETGSIAPPRDEALTETRTFSAIEVIDGRSFAAGGLRIRLADITLPKPGSQCQRMDGTPESCQDRARTRLDLITRHRPLSCSVTPGATPGSATARCRIGATDLAHWLTREGWAIPASNDETLVVAMAEAKRMKLGIWR